MTIEALIELSTMGAAESLAESIKRPASASKAQPSSLSEREQSAREAAQERFNEVGLPRLGWV